MITHITLMGAAVVAAEVVKPGSGALPGEPPMIALCLGDSLVIHVDPEVAEQVADALVEAIALAESAVWQDGPVAYLPAWRPV